MCPSIVQETALGHELLFLNISHGLSSGNIFLFCHSDLLANSLVLSFGYILIPPGREGNLKVSVIRE